jgi:hypothetical protein
MFYFIYEYMAWLTGYKAAEDGVYIEPPEHINIAHLETMQEAPEIIPFEELLPTERLESPPPSPEKKDDIDIIPFEVELPKHRVQPKRHWKRRY